MMKRCAWELMFASLVVVIAAVGCSRSERPAGAWQLPRPVRIEGGSDWLSMYPSSYAWLTAGGAGAAAGLLLRDGDLIMGEAGFHVYRGADGTILRLVGEEGRLRLAGVTIAVNLDKNEAGWSWLENASPRELELVRMISVGGELATGRREIMARLAGANPQVALALGSRAALLEVLPLFRPRLLFLNHEKLDGSWGDSLVNQPQLETLILSKGDPGSLPALPGLRRLVLFDFKGELKFQPAKQLPALKTLVVFGSELADLTALGSALGGLEELSLLFCDGLGDVDVLNQCQNLKTLNLSGCAKIRSLPALAHLKHLQWVGLPPGISQEEFAAFVEAHRNLRILEMIKCESVSDLGPLAGLKLLEGLVVVGKSPSLAVLQELKSLRFLGVHDKANKDAPGEIAAIQTALPDAMVVPVKPFCLGSGWILLLPIFATGAWACRRMSRRDG